MAAGRGNRMRPLTDAIPKAMLPHKGDTLIGNNLKAIRDKVKYIHITVGYKRVMLSEHVMKYGVDSILNTEGNSNSWWIHNTLMRYLDEPVVVLTCDNITELDLEFLTDEYLRLNSPACMLVPVKPIAMIEGDFIEHNNGLVTGLQRTIPKDIYCSGMQVLNPSKIVKLTKNNGDFYTIWNALILIRQLFVSNIYPKEWFSLDTLEHLATFDS